MAAPLLMLQQLTLLRVSAAKVCAHSAFCSFMAATKPTKLLAPSLPLLHVGHELKQSLSVVVSSLVASYISISVSHRHVIIQFSQSH